MNPKEFHKNAFWIFGVIVGLSLREPLTHVLTDVMDKGWHNEAISLEAWRLVNFILVAIRFHLGSAAYFDEFYLRDGADEKYKNKSYQIDFISGLFHFLILFGWSLTTARPERVMGGFSYYQIGAFLVMLYDNLWCLASRQDDTGDRVREWAVFNDYCALCCVLLWAVVRGIGGDEALAEAIGFIPFFLFGFMDISKILGLVKP